MLLNLTHRSFKGRSFRISLSTESTNSSGEKHEIVHRRWQNISWPAFSYGPFVSLRLPRVKVTQVPEYQPEPVLLEIFLWHLHMAPTQFHYNVERRYSCGWSTSLHSVSLSDYRSKEPDYITRPKTKKNESRIFSESLSTQTDFHACLDIFTNHPNQEAGKASKKKIKQRFPLVPFFLCGRLYPLITLNMFINVHARGRADQRKILCLLTSTMAYAAK